MNDSPEAQLAVYAYIPCNSKKTQIIPSRSQEG
jgi:hypothetical protein